MEFTGRLSSKQYKTRTNRGLRIPFGTARHGTARLDSARLGAGGDGVS